MAKKKDTFNQKELNKLLDDFLFEEPELSEDGTIKTPRYETSIINFDLLLNGGLPIGKVIAFGAEPGVGKTTLLIQACGNIIEKYGKKVYYLDIEGGATYELFQAMGYHNLLYHPKLNPDGKLFLLSVKTIQQITQLLKKVAEDDDTAVVVIDSDTSVTDQLIIDDEFLGANNKAAASNARMWSKVAGPIVATVSKSNMCLVIVHQARVNLSGFMAKIESSGGTASKHMASVEIWGKRRGWIGVDNTFPVKSRKEAIGAYVELTTEKNRLTVPFAVCSVPIFFGRGVSNKWAYRDWLLENFKKDEVTGEVVSYLNKAGAGYYTLTLPSGQYKCRGDEQMWQLIDAHLEEIIDFVNSNGGFKVKLAEDDFGAEED